MYSVEIERVLMQEEKYADLIWDYDEAAHKTFIENLAPIVCSHIIA